MSVVDVGRRYPQVFGHGDDGFDPSSIAGLGVWLDATQIASTDGTALSSWSDASGGGHHATQGTGAAQPTYQTNELNGKPVVRFDGTDDFMGLGDLSLVFPTAATLLVVYGITGTEDRYSVFENTSNNGYWSYSGGVGYFCAFRTARIDGYPAAMPETGTNLVSVVSSASTYQVYLDGTGQGAQAAGYSAGGGGNVYEIGRGTGTSEYLAGDIAELLIYNSALSNGDRTTVEAYLTAKWGV
jgi:hypothetical protein